MRISLVVSTLALLGLASLAAQSQVTNEQAAELLLFRALDSLQIAPVLSNSAVELKFETLNDEQRAFCKSRILKYLQSHAFQQKIAEKPVVLVVLQCAPRIQYHESAAQLLGAGKWITRETIIDFKAYLEGNVQGKERYWEIELRSVDKINRDFLPKIENSPFSFTRGQWVTFSRWTRILQPAIVLGSVSALIFLFYSLRS